MKSIPFLAECGEIIEVFSHLCWGERLTIIIIIGGSCGFARRWGGAIAIVVIDGEFFIVIVVLLVRLNKLAIKCVPFLAECGEIIEVFGHLCSGERSTIIIIIGGSCGHRNSHRAVA